MRGWDLNSPMSGTGKSFPTQKQTEQASPKQERRGGFRRGDNLETVYLR